MNHSMSKYNFHHHQLDLLQQHHCNQQRAARHDGEAQFAWVMRDADERARRYLESVWHRRVFPDAKALDLVQRLAPTRYFDVVKRLEPLLRR